MRPSPTSHPPEGEECETSVDHWLPLWAKPAVRYCLRRPRPSPMWGSRFVGARAVGAWVGEQKPLGKTPSAGQPQSRVDLPTYLSVHHIQGVKNECADHISRNNFDDMIGARSEELAKEAFSRMDVHLDLNMTMIRPLDGIRQVAYLK